MSDKNEQPSSRARPTSTSAWSQRPLQRGGALARTLTVISVTAILALGGLGTRSVAASGRSLALGSGRSGSVAGVSADSATDAWAVGNYGNPTTGAIETLALHWNGTKWSKFASPNPGGTTSASDASTLFGVSADSATDAWAVGFYINPTTGTTGTLALHWNGTSWSKVASPNPGGTSFFGISYLNGVSADSATDAWAVGYYFNPTTFASETLALHWNGTKWSEVASPNPGGTTNSSDFNMLNGVSADSATDAWAVGDYGNPTTGAGETLALHWNGTSWSKVASPNPEGTSSSDYNILNGVSADSATDAWAVGSYFNPTTFASETLALHWNGTSWSKVASPNPGGTTSSSDYSYLAGVSAHSATDAWAVGYYGNPTTGATETLALHWNGTSWSKVASQNPGGTTNSSDYNILSGVSADSATDAWAVGDYGNPPPGAGETLVLRWNGTSWSTA
jgi:hypothetical protein